MKLFVKILLFAGVLGTAQASFAQMRNYGKEANALYKAGLYAEAADALKKASEKTHVKTEDSRKKKAEFAYRSAECYRLIHDFRAAEQQYEKAILLKYFEIEPKVYYYLGEMQLGQCNHSKALNSYKKYQQLNAGDPLIKVRIETCEKYDEFEENAGRHEMNPMTKLNTPQFDYGAIMDSRGTTMYFTSSRSAATGENTELITNQDFSDIFYSEIDRKGNFSEPVPMPAPINTIHNEGTIAMDKRGKKMFFTRCVNDGINNLGCDIYMTEKRGNAYNEPVKIALKDHDTSSVGHPAVSPDGNTLIFASNMAGGEGGIDLWISTYERRGDTWSLPKNLGPNINTPGNDVFPVWGEGDKLYYSTDGLVGMGGLDLFVAEKNGDKDEWKNPKNLGAPLNSCSDDYQIIYTQNDENGTRGFISSNRAGSKGPRENPSQDIWSFYLPPVLIDLSITVVNQETGKPVPNKKLTVIGSDGSNYTYTTDAYGMVDLTESADGTRLIKPGANFTIDVPSEPRAWLGNKDKFSTTDIGKPTRIIREIAILDITKPLRLPEVRYDLGKSKLQVNSTVNSKDSLNYLYNLMMDNPNIVVKLMSHTDSRGSSAANRKLAQERAQSCVDYLVNEKGLPAARLVPKGYGEDVPATYYEIGASGDTLATHKLTESYINQFKSDNVKFEMLHQKNRRTEGEIISFDYVKP